MGTRFFLILLGGSLLSMALVIFLATLARRDAESQQFRQQRIDQVEQIVQILNATPQSQHRQLRRSWSRWGARLRLHNINPPKDLSPKSAMATTLQSQLSNPAFVVTDAKPEQCHRRFTKRPPPLHLGCLGIYTQLENQQWIRIDLSYRKPPDFFTEELLKGPLLKGLLPFIVGLTLLSWLVAHLATKPLRRLSNAARHLGENIDSPPLPEDKGAIEVRTATTAFNAMQRDIHQQLQQRTLMLAAIAHDLQTPLTRLRLRLEKVTDKELKQQLVKDLADTQNMLQEGLEFARLSGSTLETHPIDLRSLLGSLCDDAEAAGHIVQFIDETPPQLTQATVQGSAHLLRRAINNLLDNAHRYGDRATVTLQWEHPQAIISICDNGPGIPVDQLNAVLEPYRRLEDSRSRHTGGTGLGLSITKEIIEKHGGALTLTNKVITDKSQNTHQGLEAQIRLSLMEKSL